MKYDCNKTLDCIHELRRICDYYNECYGRCAECPLRDSNCEWPELTQTDIDILQKWSDSHPEQPKLSEKEHEFLTVFAPCFDGRAIERTAKGLYLAFRHAPNEETNSYYIEPGLFPFIGEGEHWSFRKLLGLEVEE